MDSHAIPRAIVAAAFGYLDARLMVRMMETYGLPLSFSAIEGEKRGLNVDTAGLRCELDRIGKNADTISSELEEVEFAVARFRAQGLVGTGTVPRKRERAVTTGDVPVAKQPEATP